MPPHQKPSAFPPLFFHLFVREMGGREKFAQIVTPRDRQTHAKGLESCFWGGVEKENGVSGQWILEKSIYGVFSLYSVMIWQNLTFLR